MGAAGLSPLRLLRVPLLLSLGVAALGVWMALFLEPAGMRAARSAHERHHQAERLQRGPAGDLLRARSPASRSTPSGSTARAGATCSSRTAPIRTRRSWPSRAAASSSRWGRGRRCSSVSRTASCTARTSGREGYAIAEFDRAEMVLGLGAWVRGPRRRAGPERPRGHAGRDPAADRRRVRAGEAGAGLVHRGQPAPQDGRGPGGGLLRAAGGAAGRLVACGARLRRSGATLLVMVAHYILLRAGQILVQSGTASRPGWGWSSGTWWWPRWGCCSCARLARRGTGVVR